jgi:surfeit locus 1 family protein
LWCAVALDALPMAQGVSAGMWVFPAITFGLGTWQVHRWDRKKTILAYREERRVAPPVPLPAPDALDADALEFKRVTARGRFDHYYEMRLGPRVVEGTAGDFLLTPLLLEDGRRVLVNRGFVPRDVRSGDEAAEVKRPRETVEVTGVVRKSEAQRLFTPDNDPERNIWYWMDHAALGKASGGSDYAIRLDATRSSNPRQDEPPVGGQTVYYVPNNHVSYIATWYGLTLALALMTMRGRARSFK